MCNITHGKEMLVNWIRLINEHKYESDTKTPQLKQLKSLEKSLCILSYDVQGISKLILEEWIQFSESRN